MAQICNRDCFNCIFADCIDNSGWGWKDFVKPEGFGGKLRMAREERGLSQKQTARLLHVANGQISVWETNKERPNEKNMKKICELFPEVKRWAVQAI